MVVVSKAPSRCAVPSPSRPLARLQMTIAPSSISRRSVIVLRGCASMLRSRGSISAFDLVLNGRDRLGPEMIAVPSIFPKPEGAHVRIGDVLFDERHSEC